MIKECPICNKEFETQKAICCSTSCRCKLYYQKNIDEQRERKLDNYYKIKENDYERLRETNNKATKKYKEINILEIREKGREYQRRTKSSLNRYNEIKFSGNKEVLLERDENMCQECNNTEQLVIHHIDGSGQSNNVNTALENLLLLCRKCHINIHRDALKV